MTRTTVIDQPQLDKQDNKWFWDKISKEVDGQGISWNEEIIRESGTLIDWKIAKQAAFEAEMRRDMQEFSDMERVSRLGRLRMKALKRSISSGKGIVLRRS